MHAEMRTHKVQCSASFHQQCLGAINNSLAQRRESQSAACISLPLTLLAILEGESVVWDECCGPGLLSVFPGTTGVPTAKERQERWSPGHISFQGICEAERR